MKDSRIYIRISDREKEQLKERAEAVQMTVSEYILNLIRIDAAKALK